MSDWIADAQAAIVREPVALVSILATEGSAPRGAGTRMLVTRESLSGTIGGGRLEYQAIDQARAMLSQPCGAWRVQDYPLGPLLGQCCGGRVRLLVEHLDPDACDWLDMLASGCRVAARLEAGRVGRAATDGFATALPARGAWPESFVEADDAPRRSVQLYGAGHVGSAIATVLRGLPFNLAWFDTRPDMDRPGVTVVPEARVTDCVKDAAQDAAILILTHDHAIDYRLTAAALNSDAAVIGLIGSATKRSRFLSRLAADGFDEGARRRLICPIGLAGITGKQPEVIAVAVVAQLLLSHPEHCADAA